MEVGVDNYWLYRVGAPGFDDAQGVTEVRRFSELYAQDVGVDCCCVGFALEYCFYGVEVGTGAGHAAEEILVFARFSQLVQEAVVAAQRALVVVGPRASSEVGESW